MIDNLRLQYESSEYFAMPDAGLVDVPDSSYEVLTEELVQEHFTPALMEAVWFFGNADWTPGNDCNRHADLAKVVMQQIHAKLYEQGKTAAQSVAFGVVDYTNRAGIRHRTNLVRLVSRWSFFEPQNARPSGQGYAPVGLFDFTESERTSVTRIHF